MSISKKISVLVKEEQDAIDHELSLRKRSIELAQDVYDLCDDLVKATAEAHMLKVFWSRPSMELDTFGRLVERRSYTSVWIDDPLVEEYSAEEKLFRGDEGLRNLCSDAYRKIPKRPSYSSLPRMAIRGQKVVFGHVSYDDIDSRFNRPDAEYSNRDATEKVSARVANEMARYLFEHRHFHQSFLGYRKFKAETLQARTHRRIVYIFIAVAVVLFLLFRY